MDQAGGSNKMQRFDNNSNYGKFIIWRLKKIQRILLIVQWLSTIHLIQ